MGDNPARAIYGTILSTALIAAYTEDPGSDPLQIAGAVIAAVFVFLIVLYLVVAYLIMPAFWIRYAHRHPALNETPGVTRTGDDHPGDPINVALAGSEADMKRIMLAAGWYPAGHSR